MKPSFWTLTVSLTTVSLAIATAHAATPAALIHDEGVGPIAFAARDLRQALTANGYEVTVLPPGDPAAAKPSIRVILTTAEAGLPGQPATRGVQQEGYAIDCVASDPHADGSVAGGHRGHPGPGGRGHSARTGRLEERMHTEFRFPASWRKHFGIVVLAASCLGADRAKADFAHPGVAYSAESTAFVRAKLEAKQQPWTDAWKTVKSSREASLSWTPRPREHVERGPYNRPDIGSSDFSADAAAAHIQALCWALTGDQAHAEKSAEILDAWSATSKSISNHDARLLVGMSGYKFTVAAELLKHTWDGWPADRQERFARMAREIWYPIIQDFYPSANGNWDASMLQTMMAMAVFLDDRAMFDRAKDYFLNGEGNGAIGNYFKESGQCQETGRDQGHTQMGLDFLAATCETAWIQGVDLYGALDNRLLMGFEYTAKYNLGHAVPYEPYRSFEGRYHYKSISDDGRGRFRPMYERVFNHYHNRKGIEAPFTRQAVERLRAGRSDQGRHRGPPDAALDTLMFADQPAKFSSTATSAQKPRIVCLFRCSLPV